MEAYEAGKDKINVLVVDDDEEDFFIIRDLFRQIHEAVFVVTWIKTPDQFYSNVCSGDFDLYLMDYRLDHTSGLELIARQQATCAEVPGILLTGWPGDVIMDASRKFGTASFLNKNDLSPEILWRTIQMVFANKKRQ